MGDICRRRQLGDGSVCARSWLLETGPAPEWGYFRRRSPGSTSQQYSMVGLPAVGRGLGLTTGNRQDMAEFAALICRPAAGDEQRETDQDGPQPLAAFQLLTQGNHRDKNSRHRLQA